MKKLKVFSLKVFFLIILYTIFFVVLAQSNNFIYIYTRSKTVNTPLNNTSNLIISNKVIHSSGLLNFFNKHKITTFQRAFANFNLKDTIKYDALGHSIKMLNLANYYRIAISDTSFADSLINELEKIPGVVYAEKSLKIRLNTNDPNYNIQWYLKNIGQGGGTVGADINIENAWQIFTGSSSIKIGLIDTGVKTDHEDLSGKVTGDQPDYNYSDYSHGTSVAGIAGAITNNNLGIAGVDQKAQLYSKRIFDSNGDNNNPAYVYNAIVNAVDNGCNILNNSWDGDYAPTERCAFAYAYKQNVLSIASMNDHGETTPTYPAAYGQGILSVGATDENDLHASYSESGSWIDVSAPGTDIFSTVAYYQPYYEEYYDYMSGTSFSAPVVSGIASLLKGYRPNLYNDDIQNIIELSADKVHPDIYSYDANGWN
jgi:subtilisin family serine protease